MQSSGGDWAGQAFTHCYVPKAWCNYLVSCLWKIIANRKQGDTCILHGSSQRLFTISHE